MKLKLAFLLFLCPIFRAAAQENIISSKPAATGIAIGEKVPDVLLQNVFGLPGSKNNDIHLDAFKGKLLILDFWATNCASCIRFIPGLQKLQDQFNARVQVLTVTYEQPAIVNAFIRNNPTGRAMRLPIIMADKKLSELFPHRLLSHEVWIDEQGIVRAITEPEYVDEVNIRQWLDHHSLNLPVKTDLPAFDYGKPLLTGNSAPAFYTALFPFHPGVAPRYGGKTDSVRGTTRIYVVNFPLLQLYKLSVGHLIDLPETMISIEVKDRSLLYPPAGVYRSAWNLTHSWSFESVLPVTLSDSARNDAMRQALNSFFHLNGRMEIRQARCLVLEKLPGSNLSPATKGGIPLNTLHSSDSVKVLRNASLSNIIWELNAIPGGLPASDQTGISVNVDMRLRVNEFRDIYALNKSLAPYALAVKEEKRPIEFFVLSDPANYPLPHLNN